MGNASRTTLWACALLCSLGPGGAGQPPTSGRRSAVPPIAPVIARFANPPRAYSPVPIWWWSGERLDLRRLEWQMDRMVEGHVYNTVVLNLAPSGPLYGSAPDSPPFFSEAWWSMLRRVLARARSLGMRVWLYDQLGFSTARIQDRLMERNPAWRASELAALRQDVTGPATVRMTAPGRAIGASALRLGEDGAPTGSPVNLASSLREGRLAKAMPEGRWRIMLFYETAGGYDYMSPTAAGKLLNFVHGEFERKLGAHLGSTIPGTFQDELPPLNRWTRTFLAEFRRRKGYDLTPRLPMLWHDLGSDTTKVRCDVADVRASLLEEAFFRPLYNWHQRRGMICSYDQMTRDADPIEANRYYVDYMRTMRWFQAPGADQTGRIKPHSSLAHLYGRPRVWLEGFYNSGWGQTLEEISDLIHGFYAEGANLYNPHAWYYSTLGGWWEWAPPCTSFRQPYWAHYSLFSDYVTRLSYVQSQGRHVCDVAVLYPSSSIHAAMRQDGDVGSAGRSARDAYVALCRDLERCGVDYDVLDEASLGRATVSDGLLGVAGERYRCVALPAVSVLRRDAMAKLESLVRTGGVVAALGPLPEASPDAGVPDPAIRNAVRRLVGDAAPGARGSEGRDSEGRGSGGRGSRRAGAVIVEPDDSGAPGEPGAKGAAAIAQAIAARMPAHATGVSRYVHRRIGDAEVYMLIGRGNRDADAEVTLKGAGSAWVADPWTGAVRPAPARPVSPGRTAVRLAFSAAQVQFVVLSRDPIGMGALRPAQRPLRPAQRPLRLAQRPTGSPRAPSGALPVARPSAGQTVLDGRQPDGAVFPAAAAAPRAATGALAPAAIALDEEWRIGLAPTMDNRFGDFALPASAGPLAVECRRLAYREEDENEDGLAQDWQSPSHGAREWQTVTTGHGPRWWISRADVGGRPLRIPGPDDAGWRPDPAVWMPAVFSLRTGIEKDPVYARWLGPKGRVPDDYLDFGSAPAGTVRFAATFVHVPAACDAVIRCGAGDPRVAVNGRWLTAGLNASARLLAGYNAITVQFRHAGDRPLRTFVHVGPPGADDDAPSWIWTGRNTDVSDCYARRTFTLAAKPTWATLSVTADNGYEVFVNGRRLGREVGPARDGWAVAERYPVARYLRRGRNVVAIHGMNLGGPAGLIASLRYGLGSGSTPTELVTDAEWRVASRRTANWNQPDFDDRAWAPATVIGRHPCEPWGVIEQLVASRPGALPGSAWLNGSALQWTPELVMDPRPGIHKRVGWYRFATPPGATRMWLPVPGRFRVFLDGREVLPLHDGEVEVPLDLQEHSQICVVRVEQPAGRYGGAAFEGPIRFAVGIGAMRQGDWTRQGLPTYSGGVRYVQEVVVPAGHLGRPLSLDLGRVRGTAQVAINGKPAGVRIWRPYRYDVTDLLRAGANRIEVTVYNTLAPHFGAGYPTPYVLPGQEASGLFGPVRIVAAIPQAPAPPDLTGLTNVALAANGAIAAASSEHASGQYLADTVVAGHTSGDRWARGGGWNDATESEFPDWVEVRLAAPVPMRAVRVVTLEPVGRYGIRDFDVQVRQAGEWVTVAEVRDNDEQAVVVAVPGIRSDRVRVVVHASNDGAYSRVVAVGVYTPEEPTRAPR